MATTSPKPSHAPTRPMEPWQYLAVIARCAQETGIEVDRAFRFMGAITVAMQQHATPPVAPATPPTSSTPQ